MGFFIPPFLILFLFLFLVFVCVRFTLAMFTGCHIFFFLCPLLFLSILAVKQVHFALLLAMHIFYSICCLSLRLYEREYAIRWISLFISIFIFIRSLSLSWLARSFDTVTFRSFHGLFFHLTSRLFLCIEYSVACKILLVLLLFFQWCHVVSQRITLTKNNSNNSKKKIPKRHKTQPFCWLKCWWC